MVFLDVNCSDIAGVIGLIHAVVGLIQFGIPFILIIYGLLDLGKAVMAGKEDEMKGAQKILIKRVMYAIATFVVVTLVVYIFGLIGQGSGSPWHDCWINTNAGNAKELGNSDLGGGSGGSSSSDANEVAVSPTNITLKVGEQASFSYSKCSKSTGNNFSLSYNESVIKVSGKLITGLKPGTTNIEISNPGCTSSSIRVIVKSSDRGAVQ